MKIRQKIKTNLKKNIKKINITNLNEKISRIKPFSRSITLVFLRILLIVPIALFLFKDMYIRAAGFFVITAMIGYIDLYVRRKEQFSQLTAIFDPFADKLLILVVSLILWNKGILDLIFFLIFSVKEFIMIIVGLIIIIKNKKIMFKKNTFDKWTTFFQVLALALTIIKIRDEKILWLAAGLTIISGLYSIFKSDIIRLQRNTDLDRIKLSELIKLPDYITLLNVVGGLFSIVFSINKQFGLAMIMLIISVIADFFDGKVARAMNRQGNFGKELDSLADTVSFGVAPAVFAFSISDMNILGSIAFTIFMLCGVIRLARFNISEFKGTFEGMPITMNGIITPIIYYTNVNLEYYPYIYLVLGILMVSSISVKKF
jgi:CDP-diacylglycerol---serine O-phosphatidyltransferase